MELAIRAFRKYQTAGLRSVLSQGFDTGYRKLILKQSVAPWLLNQTSRQLATTSDLSSLGTAFGTCWNRPVVEQRPMIPEKTTTDKTFESMTHRESPTPQVCEIKCADLWLPSGLGVAPDGTFIGDTISFPYAAANRLSTALSRCMRQNGIRWTYRRVLQQTSSSPNTQIKTACPLIPMWNNYYHWTAEVLTRLAGVEYYRRTTGQMPALVVPENMAGWMKESLRLLGYGPSNWVAPAAPAVGVDRLVVPSHPDPSPEECRWLRDRAHKSLDIDTASDRNRIYISRAQATRRRIRNEAAVIETLAEWGFRSYQLEDLSVDDQIRLFADAEVVVAPHGAGLANIIYSDDIKILELFGSELKSTFYRIARLMDHEYSYLRCPQQGLDLRVDIKQLQNTVANLFADHNREDQ